MITAPSIVPDIDSDVDLAPALAKIQALLAFDDEHQRWVVADELDNPLFATVPGLLEHVRACVRGRNHSIEQGERSKKRQAINDKLAVERARQFQAYRTNPNYAHMSDSDLKGWVGNRPARDSSLKPLCRSQAILVIDRGLRLIATGKFAAR